MALVLASVPERGIFKTVSHYSNILSLAGVSRAMDILWRRMNLTGKIVVSAAAEVACIGVMMLVLGG